MDAIARLKNARVRDYVYSRLFTGGGTSKQTAAGRFQDLDAITLSLVHNDKMNVVHDIAVSSGVTSLELLSLLRGCGRPVSLHISDKYANYVAAGRGLVSILDADGALVEMYLCGVLAKRDVSKYFVLTRLLYWLLAHAGSRTPQKPFVLFDPEVIEQIEHGSIQQIRYDVFETALPPTFTFVRCMNLLNLDRFSSSKLTHALRNIVASLHIGGVLQIGRTMTDGANMASFYLKTDQGLKLLQDVGNGTELRDLLEVL